MDNLSNSHDDRWVELAEVTRKTESDAHDHADAFADDDSIVTKKKKERRKSSVVLTIQLFLCLVALILLFLSKTFAFDLFSVVKNFYDTEINASLITDGDFSEFDYSAIFDSTADEI